MVAAAENGADRYRQSPIATGPRFFCTWVRPLAYLISVAFEDRGWWSQIHIFYAADLDAGKLAETSIGNYSDHPPTALTLRMDAANAIGSPTRASQAMNSSRTIQRATRRGANSRTQRYPTNGHAIDHVQRLALRRTRSRRRRRVGTGLSARIEKTVGERRRTRLAAASSQPNLAVRRSSRLTAS
jgi:hypothetical protein